MKRGRPKKKPPVRPRVRPRLKCRHEGCPETAVSMKDGTALGYICPAHSRTGGPIFITRPAYMDVLDQPESPKAALIGPPTLFHIDDEETKT